VQADVHHFPKLAVKGEAGDEAREDRVRAGQHFPPLADSAFVSGRWNRSKSLRILSRASVGVGTYNL
jgi:hypothetical protein